MSVITSDNEWAWRKGAYGVMFLGLGVAGATGYITQDQAVGLAGSIGGMITAAVAFVKTGRFSDHGEAKTGPAGEPGFTGPKGDRGKPGEPGVVTDDMVDAGITRYISRGGDVEPISGYVGQHRIDEGGANYWYDKDNTRSDIPTVGDFYTGGVR